MNLLATIANNEVVTVRGIINNHNTLRLKQGLVDAGVAKDSHQLHKIMDEILVWDEDGNILLIPVIHGIWTQPVTVRTLANPTGGYIVGSLNETKTVQYNPVSTIKKNVGEAPSESTEGNIMHFYRSDHPDSMPFMSISPLWLAVPEFQNLLNRFSEGDFSDIDEVVQVREPKCHITASIPRSSRQKYPLNVFPAYFGEQIA